MRHSTLCGWNRVNHIEQQSKEKEIQKRTGKKIKRRKGMVVVGQTSIFRRKNKR